VAKALALITARKNGGGRVMQDRFLRLGEDEEEGDPEDYDDYE
jgi:hypothetical protein